MATANVQAGRVWRTDEYFQEDDTNANMCMGRRFVILNPGFSVRLTQG